MKKRKLYDPFAGMPEELRLLCLASVRGNAPDLCTGAVIGALTEHLDDCDSFLTGRTPFDVIRTIDTAVEYCLFPLEQHEEAWQTYTVPLGRILARAEELLYRTGPRDLDEGYVSPSDAGRRTGAVGFMQKLDLYYSVLYMYRNDARLRTRLDRVLAGTKRNVGRLCREPDALKYASRDDWTEFHYPGMDALFPISWLAREYLPGGEPRMSFTRTFEQYALFLEQLRSSCGRPEVCARLQLNAEKRLQRLCEYVADELENRLEDEEDPHGSLYLEQKRFETMQRKSGERQQGLESAFPSAAAPTRPAPARPSPARPAADASFSDDLPF